MIFYLFKSLFFFFRSCGIVDNPLFLRGENASS